MRIVVDAMGSDAFPIPDVEGAVAASREWHDHIILVGDRARIELELGKHSVTGLNIEVVHAAQTIEMTDKPADAAQHKIESSMHVGMGLVRDGKADAFVSAGNTGAVLAIATLKSLRRIAGVKRPALTAIFPNLKGYTVAADIGANADCKPEYLAQFAVMSSLYAELALKIKAPRVSLLSNGEEEGKGNELVKETVPLMRKLKNVNYVGNAEPKEVLNGDTDVIISDGFSGNIFIKSVEAAAKMVGKLLRDEIKAGVISMAGGALAQPAFRRVFARIDPSEIGGAPLLGVDGVVIVGHGRSNAVAIRNAIRQAREAVQSNVIQAIRDGLN